MARYWRGSRFIWCCRLVLFLVKSKNIKVRIEGKKYDREEVEVVINTMAYVCHLGGFKFKKVSRNGMKVQGNVVEFVQVDKSGI